MTETTTLRIERTFQAPARAVFDAWTSEEVMRRWWHAEHDWETTEAAVDLRVGGAVRVVMRNPHDDVEYGGGGTYTEIEPPTRLAFTWLWDGNSTRQLIELDFEEADGATTVRFTHSGLWDEEAVRSHEGGWGRAFDNLERTLGTAAAGLHRTIPALPVRDVRAAVAHYCERFGFDAPHETNDFAVVVRDDAVLHLWGAGDEDWRSRENLTGKPIRSGAESFLAGTASCRIEVADVDALFDELQRADVLHPVSRDGVGATDFGTREFATLDLDGNLLSFFLWTE